MRSRLPIALAGALALVAFGAFPANAHGGGGSAAVTDVFSPLGFAIGNDGTFYVAEAFTGQLTKVDRHGHHTNLFTSNDGTSTSGVDVRGNRVSFTLSLPPEFQEGPPVDTLLNTITRNGSPRQSVSILDYEASHNPDASNLYGIVEAGDCQDSVDALSDFLGPASFNGVIESNPYAVAYDRDGSRLVADAAGNSILRVSRKGHVSTVAILPPVPQVISQEFATGTIDQINQALEEAGQPLLPADALDACVGETFQSNPVPTDVEIGPHGDFYVSSLPGSPENPGSGSVFKINRSNHKVTKIAGGFTSAVDIAVAKDGTLYVAELFAFQVTKLTFGKHSQRTSTFVDCPTALELDHQGKLWVANGGICTDGPPTPGQIVRLKF